MKNPAITFVQRALSHPDPLAPAERADLLDIAASMLILSAPALAHSARELSEDLRDAEASQLKFQALLSAAHN